MKVRVGVEMWDVLKVTAVISVVVVFIVFVDVVYVGWQVRFPAWLRFGFCFGGVAYTWVFVFFVKIFFCGFDHKRRRTVNALVLRGLEAVGFVMLVRKVRRTWNYGRVFLEGQDDRARQRRLGRISGFIEAERRQHVVVGMFSVRPVNVWVVRPEVGRLVRISLTVSWFGCRGRSACRVRFWNKVRVE